MTGLWLMVAPSVLDSAGPATTSARIAGPGMVSVAFLAVFAITRGLRWANLPVGPVAAHRPLGARLRHGGDREQRGLRGPLVLAPVGRTGQSRYGGGWRALFDASRLPPARRVR